MKQLHIIIIVMLGFLLIPTITFACEKHSSKKETSDTVKNDDCSEKGHADKSHDGCGGKCDHSQCGCTTIFLAGIAATDSIELENIFSASWKQTFSYTETNISSGFLSLWLIPKIS